MAASEKVLGNLHEAVTTALTEHVNGCTKQELNAVGEVVDLEVKAVL